MDTNQYLDLFLDESREHLQAVNTTLLELEQAPENLELVQIVFRSAHTLKGMAASMNFDRMATLTHRMENVLDAIRNEEIKVTEQIIDHCFEALDVLSQMVETIASGGNDQYDIDALTTELDRVLQEKPKEGSVKEAGTPSAQKKSPKSATPASSRFPSHVIEVVRQSIDHGFNAYEIQVTLDPTCQLKGVRAFMVNQSAEQHGEIIHSIPDAEALQDGEFNGVFSLVVLSQSDSSIIENELKAIMEVESVQVSKLDPDLTAQSTEHAVNAPSEKKSESASSKQPKTTGASSGSKSLRVNLDRIDDLMNLFEELIIERGRLEDLSKSLKNMELTESVERLVRTSSHLRDVILNLRMVPIEQVFNRFPRMVRSVAKDLEKQIKLTMTGQDTELDRTVIDEIGDPLVHLLRNSMDHGIEKPEVRRERNKVEEGSINLRAYHQGNHVYIEIEDDGGGINRENVLNKALSNGLITEQEAQTMPDNEVYQLLFRSGFSTAETISDLSGRGVGLDVVKSNIEALSGHVQVTSTPGQGSLFTIQLPMTLSIISAMLFKVEQDTYAIPLSSILETQRVKPEEILTAQSSEMLSYRDRVIPFIRLHHHLGLPVQSEQKKLSVLIVKHGGQLAAFTVDSLIGQQEIVVKPLGDYFKNLRGFSGATILGDGNVSLILEPADYFK